MADPLPSSDHPVVIDAHGSREVRNFFGGDWDANNAMHNQGWVIHADTIDNGTITPFQSPEGLLSVPIEADNLPEGRVENYVVYDPATAEVTTLKWNEPGSRQRGNELERDGWTIVDSNVARGVYVRSKPKES